MQMVIQAFVGAFAALVALAEVKNDSKVVRYLIALVVGGVGAVLLGILLDWIFAKV